MSKNIFFEKKGPIPLKKIINLIDIIHDFKSIDDFDVYGIETLDKASDKDMTFLHSSKYKELSKNTKAVACITSPNLAKYLPKDCIKINVKNVLLAVTKISRIFYPRADNDFPDDKLKDSTELSKLFPDVKFGKNVLIGEKVSIGNKTNIGSNTIIESNVKIGVNCLIGSFVVIKNSLISDNVTIQDGTKLGIKGFGFIPIKDNNLRIPHVGRVILEDGVEIGSNSTIDRGSYGDTVIGKNTFLDNQVHVAHNVQIGKNCMIAGQVGFAGSTTIGDNVVIGGQAGISGHLKIGNNVKIGGGSGVINNITDNQQVMGYPAVPLKDFVKQRKK